MTMTPLEKDALVGALLDPLIERLKALILTSKQRRTEYIHVPTKILEESRAALEKCREALLGEGWQPIETAPKSGLIDIWTDRRHIDCYYDSICDEYRCITAGHLIRLKDAKFWRSPPPAPLA